MNPPTRTQQPTSNLVAPAHEFEDLVVGKDVVELFSTGMYVDPLTLYREYVQNAVDAVDAAREEGLFTERNDGSIRIAVDPALRQVRILDNGGGIPAEEALRVLTAFGGSQKRGTLARGFRGVGRLAGLAYCQSLTFRTKAAGEAQGVEIRWDCRRLRSLLRDADYRGDLAQIVRDIVTTEAGPIEDPADHYFEVQLDGVVRVPNDALLNEDAVQRYLSQVAPVPFSPEFKFAKDIEEYLAPHLTHGHFNIRVNDSAPLVRPFRNEVSLTETKKDHYVDWQKLEFQDPDVGLIAVGWLLHHNYMGALKAEPEIRGLRARVGDIQVGGEDVFGQIFTERRFNSWVVGELHVLDRRIVPNARRDNFELNRPYGELFNQLSIWGRRLTQRTRDSSLRRARVKTFERNARRADELLATLEKPLLEAVAGESLRRDLANAFLEMDKVSQSDLLGGLDREVLRARLDGLLARNANRQSLGEEQEREALSAFPEVERTAYQRVLTLVFECSESHAAGSALVEQVTRRLLNSYQSGPAASPCAQAQSGSSG